MTRTDQLTSPHLRPDPADLRRLLAGVHHDPHSILGAHEYGDHTVIRAFRPHAVQVAALVGDDRYAFEHLDSGLFAAALPFTNLIDYRLEVSYPGAGDAPDVHTVADAYRFLPTLGEIDLHLFAEGRHERLWEILGAHPRSFTTADGVVSGVSFAVWAPNAKGVSLIGEFNHWDGNEAPLRVLGSSGVWELFWPDFPAGGLYKFRVHGADGSVTDRADPFAFATEVPPQTASRVTESSYSWRDDDWMAQRAGLNPVFEPMSTYEVHLLSWRPGLSYRQLAEELTEYVVAQGFTHVELMPVAEHPFGGSWGYQVTSYYAPTSRLGTPDDCRFLIDTLHQAGIGVIVDWVPAHFPKDAWALGRFDGTALYEHSDPNRGEQLDWGTYVFDFGRRRGAQLPGGQRAVLAAGVPRRRSAGGRRRLDALPGLLAARGRLDAECLRRPRKPRGGAVPAGDERHRAQDRARHRHHRRGVDVVARRDPSDKPWRAWLFDEVEHGLDERHAGLHQP